MKIEMEWRDLKLVIYSRQSETQSLIPLFANKADELDGLHLLPITHTRYNAVVSFFHLKPCADVWHCYRVFGPLCPSSIYLSNRIHRSEFQRTGDGGWDAVTGQRLGCDLCPVSQTLLCSVSWCIHVHVCIRKKQGRVIVIMYLCINEHASVVFMFFHEGPYPFCLCCFCSVCLHYRKLSF